MGAMTADEVKHHLKSYWMVFGGLLVLTAVTVGIAYIHLPKAAAIGLALVVASIKASLVALFFMHLNAEKSIIYGTLALTGVMFFFLMLVPIML